MRIALVVEDVRFARFLRPAIHKLCGRDAQIVAERKTSGCRPRVLVDLVKAIKPACDLIVIGADAARAGERLSWKRKRGELRTLLEDPDDVVLAVAQPCVEGWLLSDVDALAGGLGSALGARVRSPGAVPALRSESQAKRVLADLVRTMTGGTLPLSGFEFADQVVSQMKLADSSDSSLAGWARDLVRAAGVTG